MGMKNHDPNYGDKYFEGKKMITISRCKVRLASMAEQQKKIRHRRNWRQRLADGAGIALIFFGAFALFIVLGGG
jgi:hypothetical protein